MDSIPFKWGCITTHKFPCDTTPQGIGSIKNDEMIT
jgi:hypothetical protein